MRTLALFASVLASTGCNCGLDPSPPDAGSEPTAYRCCLRGNYYSCPDTTALQNCAQVSAPADCVRDRSRDSLCP